MPERKYIKSIHSWGDLFQCPECFPGGSGKERYAIRLTPGSFHKMFIIWIRELVFGVWCLELYDVSASTSQSILGTCQHLVTKAQTWTLRKSSKKWGLLALGNKHSPASSCSHCKGPFQSCDWDLPKFWELPWLYYSFPHLGNKKANPKVTHLWKHWSFHCPWYLIESCLCKAPFRFLWWPQCSAIPQTARTKGSRRQCKPSDPEQGIYTGLYLWLRLFGSHLAHLTELL